ncbi:hypothetical protein C4J81_01210 [Deltaproteobacteria bacterium Smac51]|nr:hypothetical protein C4J81_01210 [Deltaproteobacteria bacterium Smac51]
MSLRIPVAVISTEYLKEYISRCLDRMSLDIDFSFYVFHDIDELADIFRSIPEEVKGVITGGAVPASILRRMFPDTGRVIKAFNNDDAGIFKLFLKIFKDNPGMGTDRIYADFLEVAGIGTNEYLFGDNEIGFDETSTQMITQRPVEEILAMEDYFYYKHLSLWQAGKIDYSLSRFSNIVPRLEAAGVNVHFAYPGQSYMRSICLETVQNVRILELRDHQAAAMVVTIRVPEEESPVEGQAGFRPDREFRLRLECLNQALRRFSTVYQLDLILRPQQRGFEVLTARKVLAVITDNFQTCRLQDFLLDRLDFDIYVGYGIGVDMYQARINAVDAVREAGRLPFGASCLVNERDELIGPLRSGNKLVVSREVSEPIRSAAKSSGLSYLTVQKVMAAVRSTRDHCITSKELAHKLAITKRSANRFLSALSEAGLAEAIEVRRSTTKGRPERIYQVDVVVMEEEAQGG